MAKKSNYSHEGIRKCFIFKRSVLGMIDNWREDTPLSQQAAINRILLEALTKDLVPKPEGTTLV